MRPNIILKLLRTTPLISVCFIILSAVAEDLIYVLTEGSD